MQLWLAVTCQNSPTEENLKYTAVEEWNRAYV